MKDLTYLESNRLCEAERKYYGTCGDNGNGVFKVFVNGRSFLCVASNGGGWEHVSISMHGQKRCPTWDEMCAIKDMFFEPEEVVMQLHPAKSRYINLHPYCLHLWRPTTTSVPTPPIEFV